MNEFEVKYSDDGGATWVTVKDDTEGYFPVIEFDAFGWLWVFYYRSDVIYFDYTRDMGANWNGETAVAGLGVTPAEGQIGLEFDDLGRMWISFWSDSDDRKWAWSPDSGTTWTVGDIT